MDNLNGASLLRRTLRVDHCEKYKLPPELRDKEEEDDTYGPAVSKFAPGAAYRDKDLASSQTLERGVDVFAPAADDSKQRDGHRRLSAADAVKREAKKAKKASKKEKKRKHEKKDKKSKKKAKTDDEAPLLNYRREELPEPAQAPLVPQGRQGEVTAPSWRGSREPGAPQSWSRRDGPKRSDAPRRTWDEVERDRNRCLRGHGAATVVVICGILLASRRWRANKEDTCPTARAGDQPRGERTARGSSSSWPRAPGARRGARRAASSP